MKTKLHAVLAKLARNPAELVKHAPQACHAVAPAGDHTLRASNGQPITSVLRDELLKKLAAGEHVEIELDVRAYEQRPGQPNRNAVRFRDGAMQSVGRSGVGTPFLRDHNQYSSLSKAGTITASKTEKLDGGGHVIHQTVRLAAPWAVDMALRGLMDRVSIGWRPTGPIHCTACKAPILEDCWHFPGDELEDGGVVEWEYQEAELVETSAVNIPGVPTAGVEDVRAAMAASLSASNPGLRSVLEREGFNVTQENDMDPELLKLLGLADTATAEEVLAAVIKRQNEAAAEKATNAILQSELSGFKAQLEALGADKRKRDEDKFVADALSTGRIGKGDEEHWRALFAADEKRAAELMAKREPGSATPVGQPRQSGSDPERALVITGGLHVRQSLAQRRDAAIAQLKTNPQAAAWACILGLDPKGRFDAPTQLMAGTTISNDAQLEPVRVGFNAAFLESVAGEPDPSMMLATETSSNKKEESYSWVGELPGMQEWKTDRMLKVLEAYGLAIKNKKWEASLRLKNDDIADDNLGLLPPLVGDMAANARLHPGILVARLLLNGFDGTAFPDLGDGLAFDGEFFFSHNHVTGDNLLAVQFSADNLEAAALLLRKQKRFDPDAKEGSLYAMGTHLFVGVSNERAAEKVLTQEYLASGESNTQRGKYKLVVTPEFANGEWMLADLRGAVRPVIFQNREPLTTSTVGGRANNDSVGFMYDELWMGARARYNAGYFDFRRIVGSKP